MTSRTCLLIASVFGFLAVIMGAFGAHGLAGDEEGGYLQEKYGETAPKIVAGHSIPASYKYLQDYHTAVRYHMWHSLALLAVGLLLTTQDLKSLRISAWAFITGTLIFSGSLYMLVIAGPRFGGIVWGAITPIGGLLLLTGWCCLFAGARTISRHSTEPAD